MQLTILGSNGTYGTPGRPPSGYLVSHEGTYLWMDAGAGTFGALQNQIDTGAVDGIILSHAHSDHCLDIFGYYYAQRYGTGEGSRVPVYVPEGLLDRLLAFLGPGDHDIAEFLDFRVVEKGSLAQVGSLGLEFSTTAHPVPTVCVRVEADGRSLTYSADTGPGGGLSALAEDTDLLLCEATYQGPAEAKPWPHHLTAGEAGSIARSTGASRLMLTHIWPTLDPSRSVVEAEETFGRPVALAVPGMSVKV